ncbi:hypothetical protein Acr_24g0007310 [Actinidia rufa]|uniref:Uncharacterized protein n=1 Tax=Actinidia rufa TaxID=165716 RepID=A0A7J0GUZ2_9ERIC|nr:hypothetical protein Acr_24g0007310 [Actinidia rufa]
MFQGMDSSPNIVPHLDSSSLDIQRLVLPQICQRRLYSGWMTRGYRATIPAPVQPPGRSNRARDQAQGGGWKSRIPSLQTIDRQRGSAKRHLSSKNQGPSSEEDIQVLYQPTNEAIEGGFEEEGLALMIKKALLTPRRTMRKIR